MEREKVRAPKDVKLLLAKKLSRFTDWPGFPRTQEGIDAYVRSLLRIVHNKPIREICEERRCAVPSDLPAETIDTDWILDLAYDSLEEFPKPAALRRMYEERLPPVEELRTSSRD